jgi:hypothetical protein
VEYAIAFGILILIIFGIGFGGHVAEALEARGRSTAAFIVILVTMLAAGTGVAIAGTIARVGA